ncbi:MAG: creatininase family protein [Lawsonibacter sp.]
MDSVFMEELSWWEIKQAMEQGVDTVLICASSQEQHGPHLAENTDYMIGRAVCQRVAQRLGNTLVAPLIRPGLSNHHMEHPGSLTLRPEIFRGIVEDYVACYVKHGFRNILLCSSHGGNFSTMEDLEKDLNGKYPGVRILNTINLAAFRGMCEEADHRFHFQDGVCGGHACCLETSIMLFLHPEYVTMERAVPGLVDADREGVAMQLFREGMPTLSPCGIIGDPTPATAEMGQIFLEMFCDIVLQTARKKLGKA